MKTFREFRQQLNEFAPTKMGGKGGFDFRNMLNPPKKKIGGGGPPPTDDDGGGRGGGGGPSHSGAVRIARNHFKNVHGVGPDVTSAGDGENQVTIISHPKVKHEYSVMDQDDNTQVIHTRNLKNGEQKHKAIEVNWNTSSLEKH